jgi:hypothetical protein
MSNHIKSIRLHEIRVDPAESELFLSVFPEQVTENTQVSGRLIGPRCRYSTTVEVAYPMRESSRSHASGEIPRITVRIIIPEASLWDPESPFIYEGPLELWEKGNCVDRLQIKHGLRVLRLGQRGLRLNGKLISICGVPRAELSPECAAQLRRSDCNALLTPLSDEHAALWDEADERGFLMIGRIESAADLEIASDLMAMSACRKLQHPATLGWFISEGVFEEKLSQMLGPTMLSGLSGTSGADAIVGVELTGRRSLTLPDGVSFVACREELVPTFTDLGLPFLVLSESSLRPVSSPAPQEESPRLLGTIWGMPGD